MLTPNEKSLVDVAFRHVSKAVSAMAHANIINDDRETIADLAIAISRLERAQEPLIEMQKMIKEREDYNE